MSIVYGCNLCHYSNCENQEKIELNAKSITLYKWFVSAQYKVLI